MSLLTKYFILPIETPLRKLNVIFQSSYWLFCSVLTKPKCIFFTLADVLDPDIIINVNTSHAVRHYININYAVSIVHLNP